MKSIQVRSLFALLVSLAAVGLLGKAEAAQITLLAPAELEEGGGSFEVTVLVDSVSNLVGYQIQLEFLQNGTPCTGFTLTGSAEGEIFGTQSVLSGNLVDGQHVHGPEDCVLPDPDLACS